ncbi:D-cysteine desulfhydrase [Emcibacteraceae bacterium]|nr:D-cysteine desulfhydrase [Emcibacteraceae bacterium]
MSLSNVPRVSLTNLPTPIEYLPRLSEHLGGPQIYVKRDDCTGLAMGGNKVRKLEYLFGDALDKNANTIITHGTSQSNHTRLVAAASSKLGLKCEMILEHRVDINDDAYLKSGNVFLNQFFNADIRYLSGDNTIEQELEKTAQAVLERGDVPYVITRGGSTPVGTFGYVTAAQELLHQVENQNLKIDHIIHATASGGTQAGLVIGLAEAISKIKLLGICANLPKEAQEKRVYNLALETMKLIDCGFNIARENVVVNSDYVGDAYGLPTKKMNNALLLLARLEGLLFDPVYSGKALAGMIDLIEQNVFGKSESILFIHTGGEPGLFAYQNELSVNF